MSRCRHAQTAITVATAVLALAVLPSTAAAAATGSTPVPADVLNLTNWKLTLPTSTKEPGQPDEIEQPELASFAFPPDFTITPDGKGVVFRAPVDGATTSNSGYPRTELREMKGTELANWSNKVGTHVMTVTEAITHTPVVKPQIVAAQVHDASDDVFEVRLEGTLLKVDHDGTNLGTLDAHYQLGATFTLKIVAARGRFQVFYNGAMRADYAHPASGLYFKAGSYPQSNPSKGDAADAYGEVVISTLDVTHRSTARTRR